MNWNVYLSGEIHTNWRDEIFKETKELSLEINFLGFSIIFKSLF